MNVLVFSMAGNPRGKGRPRATVRGGRFASVYTDPQTRKYEASVAKLAKAAMGAHAPFVGPLSVSLRFRIPIPASLPKYRRARILAGEEAITGSFDIDNLAKSILDGCNHIAFEDDKQVVRLFATKVGSERPGVDVRIEPLAPQPGDAA